MARSVWLFCPVYLMSISVLVGFLLVGIYIFLTPALAFVVIPALDLLAGSDRANPTPEQIETLAEKFNFRRYDSLRLCPIEFGDCGRKYRNTF
jgi:hypothetical protein